MSLVHFDPVKHPRDRLGQFRKALRKLKIGDEMRLPGGISIKRRDEFHLRIHAPNAKTLNKPIDVKTYETEKAARKALDRSANTPHPKTLGGADTASVYAAVREEELAARARDPEWRHIPPEDDEDLFARPLHGDRGDNEERLHEIKQEAEEEQEQIEEDLLPMDRETGTRDFRSGSDEDRYLDAQDRIDRATKALKELDDAPDEDLPAPPRSVGVSDPPIGTLHTLAPFEYAVGPKEKKTAAPGTKFDVLSHSGAAWIVRTPDGKISFIPKAEARLKKPPVPTPVFHEDFFPE